MDSHDPVHKGHPHFLIYFILVHKHIFKERHLLVFQIKILTYLRQVVIHMLTTQSNSTENILFLFCFNGRLTAGQLHLLN
jgi:hypothetical protein